MGCACGWVVCSVMTDPLDFPCRYPVKVMASAGAQARADILAAVARHAEFCEREDVRIRPSRNGRYEGLTITVSATSRDQLEALYAELRALEAVKMML